jgi:peptidoglycan/xylan/chitin deacetylase (PgdA/CDA1 family)
MPKIRLSLLVTFLFLNGVFGVSVAQSKDVPLHVMPWNGFKAAMSLTYDDGDPIHLDVAVPEMTKRGLRGTFFIIAKDPARVAEWGPVAASGQEIGNHTWTHRHTNELTAEDEKTEVTDARSKLEGIAKKPVLTFAYPFVEISPGLKKWVEANDFVARGGGASNYYLTPGMEPDWMNIPSQATMSAYAYDTYKDWVDQDLSRGAWTVLMIHAIEGSTWFQPISKDIYLKFLDYLVENKKDLWIAPFGEVGGYWRAEKVLEAAEPKTDGKKTVLQWQKPTVFPSGVILKVRVEGKGLMVTQGGKNVKAVSKDVYPVSFDTQELTLTNATWKPEEKPVVTQVEAAKAPVFLPAAAAPSQDILKVDDFESATPAFGASWWTGCDTNGVTKLSPVPFTVSQGGSPKSKGHCAGMKGILGPFQAPWPWALLSLGLKGDGSPVDLSAYKAIRFYTKGDGKSHVLSLEKASVTDYCGFGAEFTSPKDWTQVTIPFSSFSQASWGKQLEKKFNDVTKISFSPGTGNPEFDFKIDDIELLKEAVEGTEAVKK